MHHALQAASSALIATPHAPVQEHMLTLSNALADLRGRLDMLHLRLEPVLLTAPPPTGKAGERNLAPVPTYSPLVEHLVTLIERVNEMSNDLTDTLDRIQL